MYQTNNFFSPKSNTFHLPPSVVLTSQLEATGRPSDQYHRNLFWSFLHMHVYMDVWMNMAANQNGCPLQM